MNKNRFSGLQAVKQLQENKKINPKITPPKKTSEQSEAKAEAINGLSRNSLIAPKRGRPAGKRSNADFQQVTAYIRRDTYRRVSIKLLDQESKGEFSELIEDLLQNWLKD